MSIFQSSSIGNFTRGGQTTIHFIRMIVQVLSKFVALAIVTFILASVSIFWANTDPYDRYIAVRWATAQVAVKGLKRTEGSMPLTLRNGHETKVRLSAFLASVAVQHSVQNIYQGAIWGLAGGLVSVMVILVIVLKLIHRFGTGQAQDEHVRGGRLVPGAVLKKRVRKAGRIPEVTIAGVPMPRGSDVAHTFLAGSSGTGKSTVAKEMLAGIRRRRDRAVVYDSSGEFVSHFYRSGKDVLLNPLDQRSASWDVWCECSRDYQYDRIAESLIPERSTAGDPYWIMGARIVFAALAKKLSLEPKPSNAKLMHAILKLGISEITHFVENTEAASIISHGGERMAISVRGVLSAYTRPLKYLPTDAPRFSIQEWVARDEGDSWVFITSKTDQKAALRPLITAWIDTASAAITSLRPSQKRRIWLFIDELPSLNRLPSLPDTWANARKFGGCLALGLQSYSQLVDIYGKDGANTIAGGCSSWCVFRFNDIAGARFASENLGNSETVETIEGISFGASEIRDGVTLSKQRNLRPIVLPTEIMNLEDLNGYVKFGRNLPIARVVTRYKKYPVVAEPFIDSGIDIVAPSADEKAQLLAGFNEPAATTETKQSVKDNGNGLNGSTASEESVSEMVQGQLDLGNDNYGSGCI